MIHKIEHWKGCKNTGLLILRIALGAFFIVHGVMKFQQIDGIIGFFQSLGFAPFFAYAVATIETVGGAMLVIGLCTRLSAFLLSIVMLVAIFKVKLPMGGLKAIELEAIYLGGLLALLFTGAGKYSIKGLFCKCNDCEKNCDCTNGKCNDCNVEKSS